MKILLKLLAVAAAFGLAPAASLAQELVPQPKQELPAQPKDVSGQPPVTAEAASSEVVDIGPRAMPEDGIGQPDEGLGLQEQFSAIGDDLASFHDVILMPIITIISIFVLLLMVYVVLRYRRKAHPVPSRTTHNTALEVAWTLIPVLILVGIAVPSIKLLARQYSPPRADLTVKVIGNQWYWTYQYPDNGDFEIVSNALSDADAKARGEPRLLGVDERMVVPAGATVKLIITSNDVIHAYGIPAFWAKLDAVPGRLNETWFKVDRPGVYYGQCFELCGARHGYMPTAVEVVPQAQFAAWVASKGGTMPGATQPTSSDASQNSPITNAAGADASPEAPPGPALVNGTATATPVAQAAMSNPRVAE